MGGLRPAISCHCVGYTVWYTCLAIRAWCGVYDMLDFNNLRPVEAVSPTQGWLFIFSSFTCTTSAAPTD